MQGELSLKDEVRYRKLRKQMEKVILQNADVVTTTCVGCGDPRLENFRFRQGRIPQPLPWVLRLWRRTANPVRPGAAVGSLSHSVSCWLLFFFILP